MGITTAQDWIDSGKYFRSQSGHQIFYRDSGSGPTILMLHPFPTWSFEFADVVPELESYFRVITPDFLGYGASDKPRDFSYSIPGSADLIEQLLAELEISSVHLLGHGLGCIVSQELMHRTHHGDLSFDLNSVMLMNCSIVFKGFRPTTIQKLLSVPVLGSVVASMVSKEMVFRALNKIQGTKKLTPAEFDQLWVGISRNDGHKFLHHLLKYNQERKTHTERWEHAVFSHEGPLAFIWGLSDPVSGDNALRLIKERADNPTAIEFPNAGHSPQMEEPVAVAKAIREFVNRYQ